MLLNSKSSRQKVTHSMAGFIHSDAFIPFIGFCLFAVCICVAFFMYQEEQRQTTASNGLYSLITSVRKACEFDGRINSEALKFEVYDDVDPRAQSMQGASRLTSPWKTPIEIKAAAIGEIPAFGIAYSQIPKSSCIELLVRNTKSLSQQRLLAVGIAKIMPTQIQQMPLSTKFANALCANLEDNAPVFWFRCENN